MWVTTLAGDLTHVEPQDGTVVVAVSIEDNS
jgi:hypothetical protein